MTADKPISRVLYLVQERPTIRCVGHLLLKAAGLGRSLPGARESDAAAVRELLVRLASLQTAGFTCEVGCMTSDPIAKVVALSPALIILDIVGDTVETRRLQRELKHHPSTRGVPLMVLTNDKRLWSRVRASQLGVQGYMVKPTVPTQLDAEMRRLGVAASRDLRGSLNEFEVSMS